ncbi:hypothetical protein PRIPAC_79894 [Pristionchus pacificus]|uniref:Uncharacterized protein n=1 Tax=Pristionchus pacificus TaxID=54126 RepID=A0A2A6CN30_PRIPA|nr:hypothetical protein PRIPAC_79894 [Pristionchus pacificus]|eukprot:PDM79604.1 hypothetical protein PRIPAC_32183 [Pristionchus pacificus]
MRFVALLFAFFSVALALKISPDQLPKQLSVEDLKDRLELLQTRWHQHPMKIRAKDIATIRQLRNRRFGKQSTGRRKFPHYAMMRRIR